MDPDKVFLPTTGETLSFRELWKRLPHDIQANLVFASLVASEERHNTSYFFGDYSLPILKYIALNVYPAENLEYKLPEIFGLYYDFVSSPVEERGGRYRAQWYQLTSYKGLNDKKLKSWLMTNGLQWFTRKKAKEDRLKKSESSWVEFLDYEHLLMIDGIDDDAPTDEQIKRGDRLRKAWKLLSEEDRDILQTLFIEKNYWEDAYEQLKEYMNPKEGKQSMEGWDNKRKQKAVWGLKARAIDHLRDRYNEVVKKERKN